MVAPDHRKYHIYLNFLEHFDDMSKMRLGSGQGNFLELSQE